MAAARQLTSTRVSPGVFRNAQGTLVHQATNQIPRATGATANTARKTSGVTAAHPMGMAGGQFRGAARTAFYNGQTAGAGSRAPGNVRGAARRAYQAGQATNPQVTTQPVPNNIETPTAPQAETTPAPAAEAAPVYKSAYDFMPADITNSPLYNWRLQQGNEALDKRLSAMGLTGSGSEIKQAAGLVNQLTGEETDKAYQNANAEANRFATQQENEAQRLYGREGRAWDNQFNLAKLYLDQNPMQYAYQGTNQYGNYLNQQGSNNAGFAADNYTRVSGGGGGGAPVYNPPFASGPNFSGLNTYNAGQGTQNRNNLLSGLATFAGGFF